jgi:hypothetical protein
MGIFSKITDYMHSRYDKKLERGLKRLNDKIRFNPDFNKLGMKYMSSRRRTRLLTEYLLWWMGDAAIISNYYKQERGSLGDDTEAELNMFWKVAPNEIIKVHTGMPGLISNKKSRLLWGQDITIDAEVYKTDEEGKISDDVDEEQSKVVRELLTKTLIPKTKLMDVVKKATEEESWSGHQAIKFNFDKAITSYPLIESCDVRSFSVDKKRGHTIAITFHEWFHDEEKNKKYRLDEIYSTVRPDQFFKTEEEVLRYCEQWNCTKTPVEIGDALITYTLYELKNGKETPIKFDNWQSACPELTEGIDQETYVYPGIKGMLAFEKPNRLPNRDFPNSNYGSSDYSGSLVSFDKLDELFSENSAEVRNNKSLYVYPMSWLDKDSDGKPKHSRDKFKTNYVNPSVDIDQTQGKTSPATVLQANDKTDSFVKKWKLEMGMICANAHMSPTSFGGMATGFESINASDSSQLERQKDTIDTRNEMIGMWKPYFENILSKLLEFNSWLLNNKIIEEQPGIDSMVDLDFDNLTITCHWPEYVQSSDQELINTWGGAKNMGVADTETAVKRIYPTLSSDQQQEIIDRIKLENGMAIDNPEALRMEDLVDEDVNEDNVNEEDAQGDEE